MKPQNKVSSIESNFLMEGQKFDEDCRKRVEDVVSGNRTADEIVAELNVKHKIIRKYLKIRGSVQGVGFRYRAEHAAELIGVTGWVRNDPDGAVSMEVQGTEEQIDKVIMIINQGTYIDIQSLDAKMIPLAEDEYGFRVRGY